MRVTDAMMFDLANTGTARARSSLEEATAENASGLRVTHPWDDPGAAGQIDLASAAQARYAAIAQAAGRASDEVNAADGALDQVNTALNRAHELAIQLSNATYSASDRAAAAAEVDTLTQTIVSSLNLRVGKRYVFGGTKDDAPPFDTAGNYLGDAGTRKVEIAPGVYQDASVRADVAIKGANGGTDVLAQLQSLSTALKTNSVAGIQATLDPLSTGISQVAVARSSLGGAQNVFDAAVSASKAAETEHQTLVSHLADADPVEAASRLALAQRALEAALTATAQGFRLSLLDKL